MVLYIIGTLLTLLAGAFTISVYKINKSKPNNTPNTLTTSTMQLSAKMNGNLNGKELSNQLIKLQNDIQILQNQIEELSQKQRPKYFYLILLTCLILMLVFNFFLLIKII